MQDDLIALAERIEAAEGPSLVLDRDVALAILPNEKTINGCDARVSVWDGNGRTQLTVRPYTASLDAAMTLVPGNEDIAMATINGRAYAGYGPERGVSDSQAATLPLAICLAAIRATQARPAEQRG